MSEEEWWACRDPHRTLNWLTSQDLGSDRKLRPFLVACYRPFLERRCPQQHHLAVLVGERYADGLATPQERMRVVEELFQLKEWAVAVRDFDAAARHRDFETLVRGRLTSGPLHLPGVAEQRLQSPSFHYSGLEPTREYQCLLCRDVFGPLPFRPLQRHRSWLAWNDGLVRRLAEEAYEHRQLPEGTLDPVRLAVLADALEEAGCRDEEILGHLRQPGGVHVRGCWVIDLLLQKDG